MHNPFFTAQENLVIEEFLEKGYAIFPVDDQGNLDKIRRSIFGYARDFLKFGPDVKENYFFDKTNKFVSIDDLNEFRVHVIAQIAKDPELRPLVFSLCRKYLGFIVGNELAMQRACNLSVQFPQDSSSLLPLHSDVWSGNSPYEVVFWLPLVDCFKTKSMYILPKKHSDEIYREFKKYSAMSAEELYKLIEEKLVWLDVPYGSGLIFAHSLLHGNRVNAEKDVRWTMNTRFKGVLSPYAQKVVGETFLPITLRPITRFGYEYQKPEVL